MGTSPHYSKVITTPIADGKACRARQQHSIDAVSAPIGLGGLHNNVSGTCFSGQDSVTHAQSVGHTAPSDTKALGDIYRRELFIFYGEARPRSCAMNSVHSPQRA